jgi:hypothetical protein
VAGQGRGLAGASSDPRARVTTLLDRRRRAVRLAARPGRRVHRSLAFSYLTVHFWGGGDIGLETPLTMCFEVTAAFLVAATRSRLGARPRAPSPRLFLHKFASYAQFKQTVLIPMSASCTCPGDGSSCLPCSSFNICMLPRCQLLERHVRPCGNANAGLVVFEETRGAMSIAFIRSIETHILLESYGAFSVPPSQGSKFPHSARMTHQSSGSLPPIPCGHVLLRICTIRWLISGPP